MKKDENKSTLKFTKIRGFVILLFGVVFFLSGTVVNKRTENKGINVMMGFGIVVMVIGFGLQAWEVGRKKDI